VEFLATTFFMKIAKNAHLHSKKNQVHAECIEKKTLEVLVALRKPVLSFYYTCSGVLRKGGWAYPV